MLSSFLKMPEEPYPLKPIFGILFTEINEKEKFPQSWKNKRRILPMAELKCPHCGQAFTVDDTELSSITQQIRDKEFEKDLKSRISELETHLQEKHRLEMENLQNQLALQKEEAHEKEIRQEKETHEKEIEKLREQLKKEEEKNQKLQAKLDSSEDKKTIAVMEAVKKVEDEKKNLEIQLTQEKDREKILLEQKDEQIAYYKDLKTKMSTKMVGETLEQHCEIQFNQLRATAFRNAYFEKDNDARTGSKGDYIYRETDANGVEIISIMFEMKNEMDETATKHKTRTFTRNWKKTAGRRTVNMLYLCPCWKATASCSTQASWMYLTNTIRCTLSARSALSQSSHC